jgi:transcriptional regulator of acetoin/glycerol metabolism
MERTKRPTLRELADQHDVSVAALIDTAVREHGTVKAAAEALGVDPQTVYQWINRHGYTVKTSSRLVRAS